MRSAGDHVRQEADQAIAAWCEIGLEETIPSPFKAGKTSNRLSGRQNRNARHETVNKVRYRSAPRQLDNDDLMSLGPLIEHMDRAFARLDRLREFEPEINLRQCQVGTRHRALLRDWCLYSDGFQHAE